MNHPFTGVDNRHLHSMRSGVAGRPTEEGEFCDSVVSARGRVIVLQRATLLDNQKDNQDCKQFIKRNLATHSYVKPMRPVHITLQPVSACLCGKRLRALRLYYEKPSTSPRN